MALQNKYLGENMDDETLDKVMMCLLMCQISECTSMEEIIKLVNGASKAKEKAKEIFSQDEGE